MPVYIEINIAGEKEASFELLRYDERAQNLGPAYLALTDILEDDVRRQFATQGAYMGGGDGQAAWAPLADSTVARKGHSEILVDTETLFESLGFSSSEGALRTLDDDDEFVWGTTIPYAVYHHSKKPRNKLPRRQLFEADTDKQLALAKVVQIWIEKGIIAP